ncbi:IS21-like element helper ATPase IstB [Trichlorobacter lovleyi]|uniref:IstB domain protein ATP-binding protein n=1 Tax=Trichlorobacter lovleyi (strain ATCC BAA-1151 / DSM 17278 / SZ) TaxID=398767 RepID=B3EBY1_TRIL1|nr:IS21-like element helper ATPase IstB [Trichlorobacter lovleyi]ACD97413.1 IstB domain protein ATP-binding protein [Trichlorobacter lovleyi SZ]
MLNQPTIEKLTVMKLSGMAKAFADQMQRPDMASLSFEERFGLIVDFQMTELENRRMQNRLRTAKLRFSASIEDLDLRQGRGMDRALILSLAQNQWVRQHHNILVTGPTGAGKSYLACALAQKACRDGHTVLYQRLPRLLHDIAVARLDGRYHKLMAPIGKCEVLVLDDLLISPLTTEEQRELLEIVEERYDRKATIVTSQLPIKAWYDAMQDPTLADAILDRLVHNAYKIELKGESMRRKRSTLDRKSEAVTE